MQELLLLDLLFLFLKDTQFVGCSVISVLRLKYSCFCLLNSFIQCEILSFSCHCSLSFLIRSLSLCSFLFFSRIIFYA